MDYKQELAQKAARILLAQGVRVFMSKSGTYGFFTNTKGSRVISFQVDLGMLSISGNYNSRKSGTGWGIKQHATMSDLVADKLLDSWPPQWAVGGDSWQFRTLAQHLDRYGESSGYFELKNEGDQ